MQAETIRIATFAAPLSRAGPGLILRDIRKGDDPQIAAIVQVIDQISPDILLLTDIDFDLDGAALAAFSDVLQQPYEHQFTARPNAGIPTGFDVDGNGRLGEARDAQGYGEFSGDGSLAVLSRFRFGDVADLSAVLWRDLAGVELPPMKAEHAAIQRLSSTGHWIVPIDLPIGRLHLLAFAATPPVFDGPEDRNGLRNRDELRLWTEVLDGAFGEVPDSFVIAGNANLDPTAGDGLRDAMVDFLADRRLQDPLPGIPTAYWPDRPALGALRVSYVLPSREWVVKDAGVVWHSSDPIEGVGNMVAGPHALVWVDISK
ncbi:endonuclease/exonuclease/phosphatase family protein [Yoonia maritima]|uniref:endonuclease/exonuclease/phosphatase family protein n=1 Tax=Yoonia maritima TaxID=1435347 RepID=UPI003734F7D7